MPVRDAAAWLDEALGGLFALEDLAVEILAVDDGSLDRSPQMLEAAAERAAREGGHPLRLLRLPRSIGQSGARNRALAEARGRWIGFLDADDMAASPRTAARVIAAAEAAGAEAAAMQFDVLTRGGLRRPGRRTPPPESPEAGTAAGAADISAEDAPGAPTDPAAHPALSEISSCWQLLLRRDFVLRAGLRFDPQLRQREDRPFVVAAICAARAVLVTPWTGVIHRLRDGSTMTRRDADQLGLFARHLHALAETLDAAEAARPGGALDAYRAAIETAALAQMLSRWSGAAADPAAGAQTAAALRGLARLCGETGGEPRPGPLLADRFAQTGLPALPRPQDALVAEGAADLLRVLACAGRDAAARRLILEGALPWPALAVERRGLSPLARRAAARALTFDRGRSAPLLRGGVDEMSAAARLAGLELVLHVGMPKTGSSAFQAWLEENRLELLDRGVLVPVLGRSRARGARRGRSAGHDLLVAALMRGDPGPLRALAGEASIAGGAPRVLISAETLLGPGLWQGEAGLRRLRAAAPFAKVRAIGLHRDPAVWVERMYREMASNPRNGFVDPPGRLLRRLKRAGLTDAATVRAALEAAFEETAFEPYEGGDAPRRLLRLAGIDPAGLSEPPARLSNPAIGAACALNILALKRAGAAGEAIEGVDPALLEAAARDMPQDPSAPLLDLDRVREALAQEGDGPSPPLAAEGCGPRQPSVDLLCAALRAGAEALERAHAARAAASSGPEPVAAPSWLPRAGTAMAGPAAMGGFHEPPAPGPARLAPPGRSDPGLRLRPPASRPAGA